MTTRMRGAASLLVSLVLLGTMVGLSLTLTACSCSTSPSVSPAPQSGTTQPVAPSNPATVAIEPTVTAPATTVAPPPKPVAKTTVRVYLVRGEYLGVGMGRTAPVTSPAKTAVAALLKGPNVSEKAMGLRSEIPRGTRLLGLSISNGTATVDLSRQFESGGGTLSMTLRIAQVVNTVTQFKGVDTVAFKIGGKKVESIGGEGIMVSPPVDRADFESALPAIMLESPLPKSSIGNPVRIRGNANVFEAQFVVRITDAAGNIVAEKPVMATSGTGTRGTFNELIKYKAAKHGRGSITVFEPSPKDGSEINKVKIPVNL
jgi:germination protein M